MIYLRILITGADLIGSHLAERLLAEGHIVLVYDNLSEYYSGKEVNIKGQLGNPNYRFLHADILDYEILRELHEDVRHGLSLSRSAGRQILI